MNEYKLSIKILLFGFPSVKGNYEIDDYILKTGILNEEGIADNIDNELFSTVPYITLCTYMLENDKNRYYNYFENKSDTFITSISVFEIINSLKFSNIFLLSNAVFFNILTKTSSNFVI